MEVNKSESTAGITGGGKRGPGRQHHDDDEHDSDNLPNGDSKRRDAFQVDGILDGAITPQIQQMLSDLAGQLEPLRQDLQRAQSRERDLRDRLERHPYLPVLNRQGLEHELSRVVGHLPRLGSAAFLCISVLNAEQIRRERGRDMYEEAMAHACTVVGDLLGPSDIMGCLGGHDLGVLLLAPEPDVVDHFDTRLQNALSMHLFACGRGAFPLQVATGGIQLQPGLAFVQALKGADTNMLERLALN